MFPVDDLSSVKVIMDGPKYQESGLFDGFVERIMDLWRPQSADSAEKDFIDR
jgi:hypothetical protein